jgi:hypothetical protein
MHTVSAGHQGRAGEAPGHACRQRTFIQPVHQPYASKVVTYKVRRFAQQTVHALMMCAQTHLHLLFGITLGLGLEFIRG